MTVGMAQKKPRHELYRFLSTVKGEQNLAVATPNGLHKSVCHHNLLFMPLFFRTIKHTLLCFVVTAFGSIEQACGCLAISTYDTVLAEVSREERPSSLGLDVQVATPCVGVGTRAFVVVSERRSSCAWVIEVLLVCRRASLLT